MKILYLSSFLAVADTCNFTKAAGALFTTQPTLSRHIQLLEEELGVQLLERDKHHVELTEAGEFLFREGKRWMADMHSIERRIGMFGCEENKKIDIICSPMYSQILRTVYRNFTATYPDISLNIKHIESGTELDTIEQGLADIAILFRKPNVKHELQYVSVLKQKLCFVCGLDSPLVNKEVVTFEDFKTETLMIARHTMSPWLKELHDRMAKHFGFVIYVDNLETINLNISNSQGIAIWPEIVVKDTQNFAKVLNVPEFKETTNLLAAWSANNTNPNISKLVDLFKQSKQPLF